MNLYVFDKDGTICRSKSGKKFINRIDDQALIPGVLVVIDKLKLQGHKIAISSNQGGVAFHHISFQEAWELVKHAADLIGADDYIMDPHHPMAQPGPFWCNSYMRKPNPGMIIALAVRLGPVDEVIVVGDREEDQYAAYASEATFVSANEFFGKYE